MRSSLLLLGLGLNSQVSIGISPHGPQPQPETHSLQKRFILEPRKAHLDWNVPRVEDTGGFLAQRTNLHSVQYFTNPHLVSRTSRDNHNNPLFQDDASTNSSTTKRATSGRWENLSGSMYSHPAPVSWGGPRQDLYYMGKDKTCQWKYRDMYTNNKWGNWEDLGGSLDSAPSGCSRKKDNIHVFCKGTDHQAWHRSYTHNPSTNKGTWGSWQSMGGTMKGYPSSCSWSKDHVSVYVSSNDGQCWHRKYDDGKGGWYGWENLGGYMAGPPKTVTWGKDHTSVFCKGQDGQAWHRSYGGDGKAAWGDWEPLGGSLDSEPAACAWKGRMDMFVKGSDGSCWHKTYKGKDWNASMPPADMPTATRLTSTSSAANQTATAPPPPAATGGTPNTKLPEWGTWENLGGDMKDGVAPEVVEVDGNMELFITGKDEALYRKTWDSKTDTWSTGWEAMGGSIDSKPNAVQWDNGEVDVYGKGSDGTLKRCYTKG